LDGPILLQDYGLTEKSSASVDAPVEE